MEVNLSTLVRSVAAAVGDRDAVLRGADRCSYEQLMGRSDRLARVLGEAGLGGAPDHTGSAPWQSPQDHVALVLRNRPELLEGLVGTFTARAVPFTVNHRYGPDELRDVLAHARARAVVFESADAAKVVESVEPLDHVEVLLQVDDSSGIGLVDGARWYHEAIATAPDRHLPAAPSPDDRYLLYTGGTTGRPRGVLWRQTDLFVAALGGRDPATGREWASVDALLAAASPGTRVLVAAPMAHGTAQWVALNALCHGTTVVLSEMPTFDASAALEAVERHRVGVVLVVGDAFARPLLDELDRSSYDVSSVVMVVSGGAALSAPVVARLLERMPGVAVLDSLGASETGLLASQMPAPGNGSPRRRFGLRTDAAVLSADRQRFLDEDDELGWLAQRGHIPLGYLDDPEGTARTFPVVAGVRVAVTGDRVRRVGPDAIELLGRDEATIRADGHVVFAEAVEAALLDHPEVVAAVAAGRSSSQQGGEEVVAIVQLRTGGHATSAELLDRAATRLATHQRPVEVIVVERIRRSAAGKPDYRWARSVASGAAADPEVADAPGPR